MTRRAILAVLGTMLAALLVPALPAFAGGGCHSEATTGSGTTVAMVDMCFTPSIVSVDRGETVTFVNEDAMIHNVGGNLWGNLEDMEEGDRFSASFDEDGVYPFACSYHPGMTGAVVVGDGDGPGNGAAVEVPSLTGATGATQEAGQAIDTSPVGSGEPASDRTVGWLGGAAIGLVIGVAVGLRFARRPRPA